MTTKTWSDTLAPRLDEMRAALAAQDIAIVASLTAATLDDATTLRLNLWNDDWLIRWPDGTIGGTAGQMCSPDKQVMILHYLTGADGTTPAGRWIAFHELPSGMFYAQAFQGYSGNQGKSPLGDINYPYQVPWQQANQMDEDAKSIMEGRKVIAPGEEGLRDIRVVEAIYQSAEMKKEIKLQA